MNSLFAPSAALAAATPLLDTSSALIAAARLLLPDLERGRAIDAKTLRAAMMAGFGGSDTDGVWDWKTAYEACEAAQVLFLRKFGPAMRARANAPAALLAMLAKVAALLPSHTRRSEESQALQQFSTPLALGLVASAAAAITPADLVLEPSAGTGLLAIFAELAGGHLVLNELAATRAGLLGQLFQNISVTRYDAAHIHDHLDAAVRPDRGVDEPAVLGGGPCGRPGGGCGAAPCRLGAGAAHRGRPPGRHHGRNSVPPQSGLAGWVCPAAGARPRGVHRRRRRPGLCPPRHHHRYPPDRHRPRAGR